MRSPTVTPDVWKKRMPCPARRACTTCTPNGRCHGERRLMRPARGSRTVLPGWALAFHQQVKTASAVSLDTPHHRQEAGRPGRAVCGGAVWRAGPPPHDAWIIPRSGGGPPLADVRDRNAPWATHLRFFTHSDIPRPNSGRDSERHRIMRGGTNECDAVPGDGACGLPPCRKHIRHGSFRAKCDANRPPRPHRMQATRGNHANENMQHRHAELYARARAMWNARFKC